jgi:protein-S-isoprenylcysteine O-methyltransferase Ste14
MPLHLPYLLLYVSGLASFVLAEFLETPVFATSLYVLFFGFLVVVLSTLFGSWAKKTLVAHETELSPHGTPRVLVTEGPFRYSRNPMYLSYVLATLGIAILLQEVAGLVPPILYFFFLHFNTIPHEEKKMHEQFGKEYLHYAKKVRRWL